MPPIAGNAPDNFNFLQNAGGTALGLTPDRRGQQPSV